jgi:hypothetical protein
MSYCKCEKCKEYHFDYEKCPDIFTVFEDDYLGEGGKEFRGYNFNDAAENYGRYRNDEGQLLDDPILIEIEDLKGIRKKFHISAELDIKYNVDEIK